jgi:amino acid adenylation domain-containing protein
MNFSKDDIQKAFKTTPIEESLLVFQSSNDTSSYIEYAVLALRDQRLTEGDIKCWIDSIERLKDCYLYEQANPLRIRLKNSIYPISIVDKPEFTDVSQVNSWILSQDHTFNVQKPPLFQVYLIETGLGQFFCLVYHHLLFDGISVQLALSALDLNSKLTFSDWNPKSQSLAAEKIQLSPFSLERLVPPPVTPEKGYSRESFELLNVSYETFMLEWLRYLQQASGSEEIIIGEVFSARDSSIESSTALGYFVQTWPVRITSDLTLEQLRHKREAIKAQATGWVKDHYTQNAFDHCWVVESSLNSDIEAYFYSRPHYVLTIVLSPKGNNLTVNFCWNLEKIDPSAALEICTSFVQSLKGNNAAKQSLTPYKPRFHSILDRWEEMVQQYPMHSAVEDHTGSVLNYTELDKASDRLASMLNINKGACVGVYTSYSASIPISFLAILKCGGIYVPLDPTVSADRRAFIIENSGVEVIISDLNPSFNGRIIDPTKLSEYSNFNRGHSELTDTCYLIYTSGTTGIPKGCAVNHLNLLNLFEGTNTLFSFKPDDRWILAHSYGFDFSTWEIWGALLNGASLYIPDRKEVQDTFRFHKLLIEKQVNILNQTPKSFYNLMLVDEDLKELGHLDYVIFGGDKLQSNRLTSWMETYPNMSLINMYGITETTVHVTFQKVQPELQSNIGKALPGYEVSLNNEAGRIVPPGFLGEIYVYGNGVCNGYYQNPLLSDEKFAENELGRHYKSGDLAWQIGDSYYYLGRRDRQVKIRGFRIELGEIEYLLKKHVATCDFIVLFVQDKLISFYKGDSNTLNPDQFRGILADYAIPSSFVYVSEFPLNQSGKIDERALLAKSNTLVQPQVDSNHLSAIYQEFLGASIDLNRSFLQNGGDSILAIRLINRLKKEGWELSVPALFSETALAMLTPKQNQEATPMQNPIHAFNELNQLPFQADHYFFPLLEAQEGILIDCLKAENKSLYVEQLSYEITSSFSPEAIQLAYENVCKSHALLRSRIVRKDGSYLFEVSPETPIEVHILAGEALNDFMPSDFNRGFDLHENLSRLTIIPGTHAHSIVWTHHHLLLDGWSLGVFSKLMLDALEGNVRASSDGFISFCCAQVLLDKNKTYWKQRVQVDEQELLVPGLPARTEEEEYHKSRVFIPVEGLNRIRQENLSQHAFMMAAWSAFLGVLFEKTSIQFGNVVSLRDDSAMDELGMYIRTLPFHAHLNHSETFVDYARRIFNSLQEDATHTQDPINAYVTENQLNHLFVFENYPIDFTLLSSKGIKIGAFNERTGAAWTTLVYPKENGFELAILHDTRIYSSLYVDHILNHFKNWLSELKWDIPFEQTKGLFIRTARLQGPKVHRTETNILEILKRDSKHLLIQGSEIEISYAQLWDEAKSLSSSIQILPGEAVGIDVKSTYHFVLSIVAVWLAQGVPCPVDRRYPDSRKEFIYTNAGIRKILVSEELTLHIQDRLNEPIVHAREASFILHTSGSTGEPKGVIQSHECLINLIRWNTQAYPLDAKEVILQLSSFGFDASFHEVLLAMSLGASLIEVPFESRLDIQQIREYILGFNATLAWIPARLLNAILEVDPNFLADCDSIKHIVTTGEALVIGKELKHYIATKEITLLNFYGPTETHVITAQAITFNEAITQPTIGKSLPNTDILLVNNHQIVPKGLPGELWASGAHLALGYLNDAQLTSEKFVFHEGQRYYQTGDWVFLDEQENLHFIGRKDDQIKIRGFRVEPLEVERLLTEIPAVQQSCVLVYEQRLFAFIVTDESIESIKSGAIERMPDYMIPSVFFRIDVMPINNNGKADRTRLKAQIQAQATQPSAPLDSTRISVQCWKAILGHTNFQMTDAFEHVGGNSILLMKMQAWLEKNAGCFISVKSLLAHNTPELLEQLIQDSRAIHELDLPDSFPLNTLQKGVLLTELGNDWGSHSPFLLRFIAHLKEPLTDSKWKEAVEAVLAQFPYLTYTLNQVEDPKSTCWIASKEQAMRYSAEHLVRWEHPLIRFIKHEPTKIEFIYHHLLMDGLGMNVLLNRLIEHLEGKVKPATYSNTHLIEYNPVNTGLVIETTTRTCAIFKYRISENELEKISSYCESNDLPKREFFLRSVALAHQYATIAMADVTNHPGIPGMFTELIPVQIDLNTGQRTAQDQQATLNTSIVFNYMITEIPKQWVNGIEIQEPMFTKYPFEWQFIDYVTHIEVAFYTSVENPNTAGIFETWKNQLLQHEGTEPKTIKNNELFDDFDF